jgi:hypothetical protein
MNNRARQRTSNFVALALPALLVTCFLWQTRLNEVGWVEILCSGLLLTFAWAAFRQWRDGGMRFVPMELVLSFGYWVYFGLGVFWGVRKNAEIGHGRALTEKSIESAILLAVCGVLCLWLGIRCGVGRRLALQRVFDINPNREFTWNYLRMLLALSLPVSFFAQANPFLLGAGGRQFLQILSHTVPLVIFMLMLRRILARKGQAVDLFLIACFLLVKVLVGISSGWLGATAMLVIVSGGVYLYERLRIPVVGVVLLVLYVLFFQAGKQAFRDTFWGERVQASIGERVSYWSTESLQTWTSALDDPTGTGRRQLITLTLSRMSLLQQTANVLEMTPSVVPYQNGRLYTFVAVTLIPRFIWPEKPSVNDANRFYQVAYGLTAPEALDGVSIAVGTLAESFINFGWFGLLIVMIPLGIFFDFFQRSFLEPECGYLFNAIGLALIPTFLAIESQLAQYLGGIVQAAVVTLMVLAPIIRVRGRGTVGAPQQPAPNRFGPYAPPVSIRS